jgi:hypothetical protein
MFVEVNSKTALTEGLDNRKEWIRHVGRKKRVGVHTDKNKKPLRLLRGPFKMIEGGTLSVNFL